jgi:hypothetical protein
MIAKYNRRSFYWGIPGIILQNTGLMAMLIYSTRPDPTASILLQFTLMHFVWGVGTVLLLIGLGYYAVAKGRNAVWCLAAILGIFGLIILALLKDRCPAADDSAAAIEAQVESKWSTLAVLSPVLGFMGLFSFGVAAVLGLVAGIAAIIRISRSQGRLTGRGAAIIGIVISSVIAGVFGYVVFLIVTA